MLISNTKYLHYLNTFERIVDWQQSDHTTSIESLVDERYQSRLRGNLLLLNLGYAAKYSSRGVAASVNHAIENAAFLTTVGLTVPRVIQLLSEVRDLSGTDRVKFKYSNDPLSAPCVCLTYPRHNEKLFKPSATSAWYIRQVEELLEPVSLWMGILFGKNREHKRTSLSIDEAKEIQIQYKGAVVDLARVNPVAYVAAQRIFSSILNSTLPNTPC